MRTESEAPALLHSIQALVSQQTDDLWAADEIASYLKMTKKSVQNRILNQPRFPEPVKLPCGKRWVAKEVRAWAMKHR